MLLRRETLLGIEDGSVTLAFRRWRRPTVKAGGTLLTRVGQLSIEAVDRVDLDAISAADAKAAGHPSLADLKEQLESREGDVFRVRLSHLGEDPRIALRREIPDDAEMDILRTRLDGYDARSTNGPWTRQSLDAIAERPAVRAGDLADDFGMVKKDFKVRIRKLKALGLTESLEIGYRLSPRGESVRSRL